MSKKKFFLGILTNVKRENPQSAYFCKNIAGQ